MLLLLLVHFFVQVTSLFVFAIAIFSGSELIGNQVSHTQSYLMTHMQSLSFKATACVTFGNKGDRLFQNTCDNYKREHPLIPIST